jgi:ankyrin repeat protein
LPNTSCSSSEGEDGKEGEEEEDHDAGIENEKHKKLLQNKLLIQFKHRAAESGGEKRHLPIHFAAQYQLNCEVVQLLYEVNPDTLSIQDKIGNTPLGVSLLYNSSCEIIRLLIALSSTGFYIFYFFIFLFVFSFFFFF